MSKPPRLQPQDINRVGDAVLTLARELWVVKDRQFVLERILDDHGIDVSDAVQQYEPDASLREQMDAERKAYLDGILKALAGNS